MNDMIRLIALDLDNTLLEKNNEIAPVTLSLLQSCSHQGVRTAIATGRILPSALKYAREIGDDTLIVCYNGCLSIEASGKILFSRELSTDIMRKVISFSKEMNLYCQFYKDHKIVVEKVTEGTTIDPDLLNTAAVEVGDFSSYDLSPSPKAMIVVDPDKLKETQKALDSYLAGEAYLAQSQPYLIEIMPKGVNKAHTLELVCDSLGIDRSQVMACGDNTNDAEMIQWAGTGIAVANSVDIIKEKASYVCKNERSLGVAEAIRKFVSSF